MKNTKRRLEVLSFYDSTGIVAHLEKMALKGWALERISNSIWRYRRVEPKKLRYAAVYLPSSSEFDPGPTEANRELQEFCARAGWVQVGSLAQMHIFCSESENPIPIETEPMVQIETIHRAMKKNFLPSQICMLVLGILQMAMQLWTLIDDPLDYLSSAAKLVGSVCWVLVIAMSVNDIVKYYRWRKKAIPAAEDGEFLPTKGSQRFQYVCLVILAAALAGWLLSISDGAQLLIVGLSFGLLSLVFAAVFGIKALFKKLGLAAGVTRAAVWITAIVMSFAYAGGIVFVAMQAAEHNWFEGDVETYSDGYFTFEVHHDELPLNVEDLMETDYDRFSTQLDEQGTFLLTITQCSQQARSGEWGGNDLAYTICDVRLPLLKKLAWNEMIWPYNNPEDLESPMELRRLEIGTGDVSVYQLYDADLAWNVYFLHYDARFVKLCPDWSFTDGQLLTAADILAP